MKPDSGAFPVTHWTLALKARDRDSAGERALTELCAAYYTPVVAFIRSEGRTEDAARDLAHGFFERLLGGGGLRGVDPARGRFRSYLLGAVKHYLRDQRAHAAAKKRGGGVKPEELDEISETATTDTAAEHAYDRQWALTIVARALDSVSVELHAAGKTSQFEALKPWITGDDAPLTQSQAAAHLGMSEGAVKVAIHRLRQRFREEVKAEVSRTIPAGDDVDEELQHLITVLAG
jgi:RNA polymerase sigma factor (sigma-70 family)